MGWAKNMAPVALPAGYTCPGSVSSADLRCGLRWPVRLFPRGNRVHKPLQSRFQALRRLSQACVRQLPVEPMCTMLHDLCGMSNMGRRCGGPRLDMVAFV